MLYNAPFPLFISLCKNNHTHEKETNVRFRLSRE
jgi:hypothetical protein